MSGSLQFARSAKQVEGKKSDLTWQSLKQNKQRVRKSLIYVIAPTPNAPGHDRDVNMSLLFVLYINAVHSL